MMTKLLSIMSDGEEQRKPESSLIEVHDTIWLRVLQVCLEFIFLEIWDSLLSALVFQNSPKGTNNESFPISVINLLTTAGVQRRFAEAMRNYCQGAVEHVQDASNRIIPNLEEYLAIHRKAAGVTPIFALVE